MAPNRSRYRPPDLVERRAVERRLADLPGAGKIPRKEGELAFDAPWQVRAVGVAVELHNQGHFPWPAFQSELAGAIAEWEQMSPAERGDWSYYRSWMEALEALAIEQGLVDRRELDEHTEEFLSGKRDPKHR